MKDLRPFRFSVRVLWHENGHHTRVAVERAGGGSWEIPTEIIPPPLRRMGSRFWLVGHFFMPEPGDTVEEMRAVMRSTSVEEIGETQD